MPDISINARSSIRIKGTKIIYFDPYKISEEKHDADIVFITHSHHDHFSVDDIKKVANEKTILVVPFSMNQMVCENLVDSVTEVRYVEAERTGEYIDISGIMLKWVRAYNIDKPFHEKESNWIGYVVTMDGDTYFVTGDTDANEDNTNVVCDVLFVSCGGKYTFDAKEAAEYTARIMPKIAIPTHYTDEAGTSDIGAIYRDEVQKLNGDIDVKILI